MNKANTVNELLANLQQLVEDDPSIGEMRIAQRISEFEPWVVSGGYNVYTGTLFEDEGYTNYLSADVAMSVFGVTATEKCPVLVIECDATHD